MTKDAQFRLRPRAMIEKYIIRQAHKIHTYTHTYTLILTLMNAIHETIAVCAPFEISGSETLSSTVNGCETPKSVQSACFFIFILLLLTTAE